MWKWSSRGVLLIVVWARAPKGSLLIMSFTVRLLVCKALHSCESPLRLIFDGKVRSLCIP